MCYKAFQGFGQAKFAYGAFIIGLKPICNSVPAAYKNGS